MSNAINIFLLNFLFVYSLYSQNSDGTFNLSADELQNNKTIEITPLWKYHAGDNDDWADPSFNDSDWEIADTRLDAGNLPQNGWKNIGWFRLHVFIDSSFIGKPLGLRLIQAGACEVYLNGKLLYEIGKVGTSEDTEETRFERNPKVIVFPNKEDNVLAVRYSIHASEYLNNFGIWAGFRFVIADIDLIIENRADYLRSRTIFQMLFMVTPIVLALLHLFLFLFEPSSKQNLFYVLFLVFFTLFIIISFQPSFAPNQEQALYYYRFAIGALVFTLLFATMTVYSIFSVLPKKFYLFMPLAAAIGLWGFIKPSSTVWIIAYTLISIISFIAGRIVFRPRKSIRGGEWIIRSGFIIMSIAGIYQMLISMNVFAPIAGYTQVYFYGVLVFIISMSLALARDYVQTSKNLKRQLVNVKELSEKTLQQERLAQKRELERKLLEADNERKTHELEEARKLQLSMLPQKVPEMKNLDIAVYMKTATEVGGDYYDFKQLDDNSLTVAIGDATGHGMKAGTMVTAVKSLFGTFKKEENITEFFHKSNNIIQSMNLGNLFMALMVLRLDKNKLIASSAGIPPMYIYRNDSGQVEEITIKGMPLGGRANFPYQQYETNLNAGDTLLLLSDGLPELFNTKDEMFGYAKIKELFTETAKESPQRIIDVLVQAGEKFRNGRAQEDDITFVVIKNKD